MQIKHNPFRRNFLKTGGMVVGVATLAPTVFGISTQAQSATHQSQSTGAATASSENDSFYRGRMFFMDDLSFETLSEAAERIFPADSNGPGAIELKVPFFIDNQLAGAYGYNAREYIYGPFAPGVPGQGYQTSLLRRDIFQQGIIALNEQSSKSFKKNFPQLSSAEKDKILKMCESRDIPADGFSSSFFFSLLRSAVLAGVYADPIYGGNAAMGGWKMKNATGYRAGYLGIINSDTFEEVTPVSLAQV